MQTTDRQTSDDLHRRKLRWPHARGVAMTGQFERHLDLALETRHQRLHQQQAEQDAAGKTISNSHAVLERMQTQFCGDIRSLIEEAIQRANRHLAKRLEKCRLCEVSGYFTGPLFVGGSACNPIAFELRLNGSNVGETLIVELTHNGMIEAYLGPMRPGEQLAQVMRRDFGWDPVPLQNFTSRVALDLVLRYMNMAAVHLPLDGARSHN